MAKTFDFEQIPRGKWGKDAIQLMAQSSWQYNVYEVDKDNCLLYIQMYPEDKPQLFLVPKYKIIEALGHEAQ